MIQEQFERRLIIRLLIMPSTGTKAAHCPRNSAGRSLSLGRHVRQAAGILIGWLFIITLERKHVRVSNLGLIDFY